jgi:hypothetical protein
MPLVAKAMSSGRGIASTEYWHCTSRPQLRWKEHLLYPHQSL